MTEKMVKVTERWLDARIGNAYLTGARAQAEAIAKMVRAKAGEAYAHGEDARAAALRSLASEIDAIEMNYRVQEHDANRDVNHLAEDGLGPEDLP